MSIVLVRNDDGDWIGLYVDGKLVDEGHSFESSRLLTSLGIEHEDRYDVDLEKWGRCPPTLAELDDV